MSQLLAMSFDSAASPSITLKAVSKPHDHLAQPYGWGFAWYPSGDQAAVVIKDPTSIGDNAMTQVLRDWERFRSTVFVCHLLGAAKRTRQEETHPFSRSYAGRDWIFAHNGDLQGDLKTELPLGDRAPFEPVGHTDTELAFCWLLKQIWSVGGRRLADVGWDTIYRWCRRLDGLGTFNAIFTDGQDLIAYQDATDFNRLHFLRRRPPHAVQEMESDEIRLDLANALDVNRTCIIIATKPLSDEPWTPMKPGQLLVMRRSEVTWDSHIDGARVSGLLDGLEGAAGRQMMPESVQGQALASGHPGLMRRTAEPARLATETARLMRVSHITVYRYENPVERSGHVLRLRPVHDPFQELVDFNLYTSSGGLERHFEDVFGNQVTRFEVDRPFQELRVEARSLVRLTPPDAAELESPAKRFTIPLVWMPWQRQMMNPYLLPPELPETQLRELSDYAMSFVARNDYDLVDVVLDINETIYRDFTYVSGSTNLETTPFEVYINRRGVCQDFANLLICLARLLGIPARYRVGYIYTAAQYDNKMQSDASHAWAELYLPWAGWRGFDPTNNCTAGLDHIRVACGRNYRDATPTSGTIYKGGGREILDVSVQVEIAGHGELEEPVGLSD